MTGGRSETPNIRGMLGPYTSASIRPTRCPAAASATARLAETVDFPTPPLPEEIAMIRPRLGSSGACGAAAERLSPPAGGPWVTLAGPGGIDDRDLDRVPADPLDLLDGRAGLAHQRGRDPPAPGGR